MDNWLLYACLSLGFASAIVAGVFLTFSDFVMAGLSRARTGSGVDSMQQINRTVFRSVFLAAFFALMPLTGGLAWYAAAHGEGLARLLIIAAAVTYWLSVVVVTVAGNVPMNERLDKMPVASDEARAYWPVYCHRWTRWNHVRTVGSAATSALFLLAAAIL